MILAAFVLLARTAHSEDLRARPIQAAALAQAPQLAAAEIANVSTPRPTTLRSLYVTYGVLQALDVYTTTAALRAGGAEANPMLGGIAGRPAALIAIKAAGSLAIVYFVEKLRKKNRVAAVVTMAAIDSAYAMIVVHNARVAGRLGAR